MSWWSKCVLVGAANAGGGIVIAHSFWYPAKSLANELEIDIDDEYFNQWPHVESERVWHSQSIGLSV